MSPQINKPHTRLALAEAILTVFCVIIAWGAALKGYFTDNRNPENYEDYLPTLDLIIGLSTVFLLVAIFLILLITVVDRIWLVTYVAKCRKNR